MDMGNGKKAREVVLIPTFQRNAYLHCALRRIRGQDGDVPIFVFSDRGEDNPELHKVTEEFEAQLRIVPVHDYFGNSFCVMEAFRWAVDSGYDLIHLSEDDVMQHSDCLAWHREIHEELPDIFASCGWIFNHHAPIIADVMFANWYYSPNACFKREKLAKVAKHANPLYYNAMWEYAVKAFPNSILHRRDGGNIFDTSFYEQDAIVQFCLMEDKSQVAWCGISKVDHIGTSGYNKMNGLRFYGTIEEQIRQIESFIADPYARIEAFGRPIVERELGREVPKRIRRYRITLPGGWVSEFESELSLGRLPRRINSTPVTSEAKIMLL